MEGFCYDFFQTFFVQDDILKTKKDTISVSENLLRCI